MEQYSRICFSNFLEERFQKKEISQRQHSLLSLMMKYSQTIDESAALKRNELLIKSIYANVKSERTIRRDLDELKAMRLLSVNGKELSVNYEMMRNFIGINPDALFEQAGKTKK